MWDIVFWKDRTISYVPSCWRNESETSYKFPNTKSEQLLRKYIHDCKDLDSNFSWHDGEAKKLNVESLQLAKELCAQGLNKSSFETEDECDDNYMTKSGRRIRKRKLSTSNSEDSNSSLSQSIEESRRILSNNAENDYVIGNKQKSSDGSVEETIKWRNEKLGPLRKLKESVISHKTPRRTTRETLATETFQARYTDTEELKDNEQPLTMCDESVVRYSLPVTATEVVNYKGSQFYSAQNPSNSFTCTELGLDLDEPSMELTNMKGQSQSCILDGKKSNTLSRGARILTSRIRSKSLEPDESRVWMRTSENRSVVRPSGSMSTEWEEFSSQVPRTDSGHAEIRISNPTRRPITATDTNNQGPAERRRVMDCDKIYKKLLELQFDMQSMTKQVDSMQRLLNNFMTTPRSGQENEQEDLFLNQLPLTTEMGINVFNSELMDKAKFKKLVQFLYLIGGDINKCINFSVTKLRQNILAKEKSTSRHSIN